MSPLLRVSVYLLVAAAMLVGIYLAIQPRG
jgi:hypothetical protein